IAARVEKRMARARPFLRTDRLTTVIPTRSASSVKVMSCCSSSRSRWTAMWWSGGSGGMSDGAFHVFAEAQAMGEDLGEEEHHKPGEQRDGRSHRAWSRSLQVAVPAGW